ncbi:MAG: hypothetical protein AAGE01_05305 [Pseudomonadota bacterium]
MAVQVGAAGGEVLGKISAQQSVYVTSAGVQLRVAAHADQILGTGDLVTTNGENAWGTVEIDGVGTIEVGPDARVSFDRTGDVVHLTLIDGGLRYSVKAGVQVVIEAAGTTVLIGRSGAGVVPAALGDSVGAVIVDGEAVYARNGTGELQVISASADPEQVAEGELLAVNSPASPNGSPVSLQVGSGASGSGTSAAEKAAEEEAKRRGLGGWWSSLTAAQKALVIAGGAVGGFVLYDEVIRDDSGPDSPS